MPFLRIIDVNLNRLEESLKLIEDVARFNIADKKLLLRTRELRRRFLEVKRSLPMTSIISARRSGQDPGRNAAFDSRRTMNSNATILANLSRAKQASRTIEEALRTADVRLSRQVKEIRFQIYDLEKDTVTALEKRFDPYLHAIIDEKYAISRDVVRVVRILADNGATMIQLRIKSLCDRAFLELARKACGAARKKGVVFIVNDRVDIALACQAHGVHLGQTDMDVAGARRIMGEIAIIGASVHTLKQAARAERDGADYLGVGAVFPTKTKSDARICGLDTLERICRNARIPVIAIGGVTDRNYRSALRRGAAGIAVASYLFEGNMKERICSLTRK